MGEPTNVPGTGTDNPQATPPAEYEFNEEQNEVIGSVGASFWIIGLVVLFQGIKQLIRGVSAVVATSTTGKAGGWAEAASYGALALFLLPIGYWFLTAGSSFEAIVKTQGSDISHLMTGFRNIRRSFTWVVTLALIGLGIGLVILILQRTGVV